MKRILTAVVIASVLWIPLSMKSSVAIYCYPGDPPAVYQACVAYNQGIGAQVTSETQMVAVLHNISSAEGQINALIGIIKGLEAQIKAQQDLINKTQLAIDDLDRQIRFTQASVTRLHATISVRDALLNQRLRYVDDHGSVNYVELVLTANTFNDLMNRMIGAQQVAASDRKLLDQLGQDRAVFDQTNANLTIQRAQVAALLQQLQATKAELQKNQAIQKAALGAEQLLEVKLNDQYRQLGEQRKAIDAQVATLQQQYDAAARKAGGGTGAFAWPEPACGFACISQPFGCVSFYLEIYDPSCPYPHRKHTGIDIAAPPGSPIVAADTGIIYFYPGSIGYGNMIMIIHGNGYSTVYGHLAGYAGGLSSGQIIARGDLIGYEGSTGWSTGAHLHFEIRVNNDPRDPCIWLGC
ncbi:MAG TPA: peptidoglycan DD-metalloendopeptidase family protein [Candidatus Dormibacteraeota bacterium]|nr:peptidoglycan DD-metalloendopeptidase family protein [Candidatus Dormibacteraeota bacterium]